MTGQIELKSVRNVQWDLLIEEFNGVRPLPREIRALLEHAIGSGTMFGARGGVVRQ